MIARINMERQYNLDSLKCISAFLVVCIHLSYADFGIIIKALSRVAVPIFLLISGYFYPVLKKNKKHWPFFCKIIKLTIYSNVFYLLVDAFIFHTYIVFDTNKLIDCVLFNANIPNTGIHLWYFNALIYTILFVVICDRYISKLYRFVPILFFVSYVISSITTNMLMYRNFLFMALPYFLTGYYIHENRKKIQDSLEKVCNRKIILLFIGEICLLGAEIFIYKKIGLPEYRDHYLMTIPMALTAFWGALYVFPNRRIKYVSIIGQKYSSYVYIYHIFVLNVISFVLYNFAQIDFSKMYYINVLVVFVLTVIIVHVYLKIKEQIFSKMKKQE